MHFFYFPRFVISSRSSNSVETLLPKQEGDSFF